MGIFGQPQCCVTSSSALLQGTEPAAIGKYQLPTAEIRFLLHVLCCGKGLVLGVSWLFSLFNCKDRWKNTKLTQIALPPSPWWVFWLNKGEKSQQSTWFGWKCLQHFHLWKEMSLCSAVVEPEGKALCLRPHTHLGAHLALLSLPTSQALPDIGMPVPIGVTGTHGKGWSCCFAAMWAGPVHPAPKGKQAKAFPCWENQPQMQPGFIRTRAWERQPRPSQCFLPLFPKAVLP